MFRLSTVYTWKESKTSLTNMLVDFDVKDNRGWTFFLEQVSLWIMESYFGQELWNMQLFTSQYINWWTGMWIAAQLLWYVHQLFGLSFWRHPFTAEDPLVSDVMLNFSKSVLMKKQPHLHLGWPESEYMLIYGWTILLMQSLSFKKNHVHVVLCLARSLCTNADLSLARTDKPCRRIGTTVWSRYARVGRVCRVWGSTFCLVTFSADVFSFSTIL